MHLICKVVIKSRRLLPILLRASTQSTATQEGVVSDYIHLDVERAGRADVFSSQQTRAGTLVLPGTSNPFLAGMPSGSTCCDGDSAPTESPVHAGAVSPTGVTGGWRHTPTDGPNGNSGLLVDTLAYEGVSTINDIAG